MTQDPNPGGGSALLELFAFKRGYQRAPQRQTNTPGPAPAWPRYIAFEDGVSADDFAERPQFESIPRPLTGSGSSTIDWTNSYYGREMNQVRKANNALEATMPTTPGSIGAGITSVPQNLYAGLQVLTNPEVREKLDRDTRALLPFTNVMLTHGPQAVFDAGTGAVKDSFWSLLQHPFANLAKMPEKGARLASLAATPQAEHDRLRENVHERFDQLKLKMGAGVVTGGMLSWAVKNRILATGMRGAPLVAGLAGLGLFGLKTVGSLSQAVGEVAQIRSTMVEGSEGHHFDKRILEMSKSKPSGPAGKSEV